MLETTHFMAKKILTIGLDLADESSVSQEIDSRLSLLDWDIVLFKPQISDFIARSRENYQGKPSLNDTTSFQLTECGAHWRREIKHAFDAGKTIIIFLPELQQVYVDTGRREYSGTGRNQKTTRIVELYSNYKFLPLSLSPVNSTGSAIKLTPKGDEALASYWASFGPASEYKVLLTGDGIPAFLVTKNGDKTVGAIYRGATGAGALVLLPDVDFYRDEFFGVDDKESEWTPEAVRFGNQMVSAAIALERHLHSATDLTPPPAWAADASFVLPNEEALRSKILRAEHAVEIAQKAKEELLVELRTAGQLRGLLYEKGRPLELSIIFALTLLGFKASGYKEGTSEFDVVFECPEGRLLGEAEGKDNKAVNIDKLRQLSMNIHEDLMREDVDGPAKPVLFGNGYRLTPPGERAECFTSKCISAAQSSSTALVPTAALFAVAQYLSSQNNEKFAGLCRTTLLEGAGVVTFPDIPTAS